MPSLNHRVNLSLNPIDDAKSNPFQNVSDANLTRKSRLKWWSIKLSDIEKV
jgi:hypothetical protein